MDKDTANNYTLFLIITFFIAIYIICLVYLFKKESEISSIILLIIYQTMLMFYLIHKAATTNIFTLLQIFYSQSTSRLSLKTLSQVCVSNENICKEGIKVIIWYATLITSILNFVSLILFIITYQHLYKEYNLDGDKTIPLSKNNEAKIKQFKTFLLVSIVFSLFLILMNAFDITSISMGGLFGKILVFGLFGIIVTMISLSSYNVYIANDLLKLKNTKVISR